MTDNGTIEAFRGDEQKAINTFRGDDTEAFSSGLFFIFFLCLFVFSSFPGVMRGLAPSLSVLSFPKSLIGNPPPTSCLSAFIRHPEVFAFSFGFLNTYGPLIEPFRGDE